MATDERRLLEAHLAEFPVARRRLVPAPEAPDEEQILRQQTDLLLSDVSRFNRAGRAAARVEAARNAEAQLARLRVARLDSLERAQASADRTWELLLSHDPEAVRTALTTAFQGNDFPTAVLEVWTESSVNGVSIAVHFAPVGVLPPVRAMGSTVLAAVRRTLAACPSVEAVRVVVLQDDGGATHALFAGDIDRPRATTPGRWDRDPARALLDSTGGLLRLTGDNQQPAPLDPQEHPWVADLLTAVRTT